jgi:hypothetical protein
MNKNNINKIFFYWFQIMVVLTWSSSLLSSEAIQIDRAIKAHIFQLEQDMANAIEGKIAKFLSRDLFWLSLHLTIDRNALKRDFYKVLADNEKRHRPRAEGKNINLLPGLPLGKSGAPIIRDNGQNVVVMSDGPEINRTMVLSYATDVSVEVAIDQDNERQAQTALRKLITDYFKELDIPVEFKFNRRKIAGLMELDSADGKKTTGRAAFGQMLDTKNLARDFSSIVSPGFLDSLEQRYSNYVLAFVLAMTAIAITSLSLIVWTIKANSKEQRQQMQTLSNSIVDSGQGRGTMMGQLQTQNKDGLQEISSREQFLSEAEMTSAIKDILLKKPNLSITLLRFFFREEMYEDCLMILQCLGPEYSNWSKKELTPEEYLAFVLDLRQHGNEYLSSSRRQQTLRNLYTKIWQASFDMNNFVISEITSKLEHFQREEIVTLLAACNPEECALVIELLPAQTVAWLIRDGKLVPDAIARLPVPSMSKELLKGMLAIMAGRFRKHHPLPIENIARYLPLEMELPLYRAAGMPEGFHLEDLAQLFPKEFAKHCLGLSLDELSQLLGVCTKNVQQSILEKLPTIKARRLEQRIFNASDEGIMLKHQMALSLRSLLPFEKWKEYKQFQQDYFEQREKIQKQSVKMDLVNGDKKAA